MLNAITIVYSQYDTTRYNCLYMLVTALLHFLFVLI